MPRFRSRRSPERQAEAAVGRLVNLGVLRRNPNRPASARTVENHRQCLTRVARDLEAEGLELRDLTPETAVKYLEDHTHFGQKHLDMHRQAIQAVIVHVTGRLPKGRRLPVVRSSQPSTAKGRACTPVQYRRIAAAQTAPHALATAIAHAAGLRAHELLTLARPDERPPDRRPTGRRRSSPTPCTRDSRRSPRAAIFASCATLAPAASPATPTLRSRSAAEHRHRRRPSGATGPEEGDGGTARPRTLARRPARSRQPWRAALARRP